MPDWRVRVYAIFRHGASFLDEACACQNARMKPTRGRLSFREQLTAHQKSMDVYAALAGKPKVQNELLAAMAPPRKRAPAQPSAVPLEKDIQKAIIEGLRMHPMVGLVERVNSGTAVEQNGDGTQRHIAFHHVYRVDERRLRSVDVHATLKPSGRRLVIEVKRPGWNAPRDKREREQANYLARVRECGGFGIFATCWEDVAGELRRIASGG